MLQVILLNHVADVVHLDRADECAQGEDVYVLRHCGTHVEYPFGIDENHRHLLALRRGGSKDVVPERDSFGDRNRTSFPLKSREAIPVGVQPIPIGAPVVQVPGNKEASWCFDFTASHSFVHSHDGGR